MEVTMQWETPPMTPHIDDRPRAVVITGPGINCDLELVHAFAVAGADVERLHLHRLMEAPELIDGFDLIGLPGGFSYGDAVAAGRIMAHLMRRTLYPALVRAIRREVPIFAPCNGFQIAAQLGLLPGPPPGADWPEAPPPPRVALAFNDSARFVDRWVAVEIPRETVCLWTRGLSDVEPADRLLPVAHGEGRFVALPGELDALERRGQVALRYAPDDDPNGSQGHVAGICDASGLVFGLMPHPERFVHPTHHPRWTRRPKARRAEPLGLRMFRAAVAHAARMRATR
jgi:phosphoribosylformylglycinamidine synthase